MKKILIIIPLIFLVSCGVKKITERFDKTIIFPSLKPPKEGEGKVYRSTRSGTKDQVPDEEGTTPDSPETPEELKEPTSWWF